MEPLRIEIAIHLPGGAPPVHVVSQHDVDLEHHAASGLGTPSAGATAAAKDLDRPQLIAALEEAHRTHHEAVELNKQLNDRLRERTIERDHFREDSLLWGLVVSWLVDRDGETTGDGRRELDLPRRDLDAYLGKMLGGEVDQSGEVLTITLGERPGSTEGT
jgi:hypothetical protein